MCIYTFPICLSGPLFVSIFKSLYQGLFQFFVITDIIIKLLHIFCCHCLLVISYLSTLFSLFSMSGHLSFIYLFVSRPHFLIFFPSRYPCSANIFLSFYSASPSPLIPRFLSVCLHPLSIFLRSVFQCSLFVYHFWC